MHHEVWPHIFANHSGPLPGEIHWRQNIAADCATTYVVEQSGELIAFATVALVDAAHPLLQSLRYAKVGTICVAEPFRGQGIGRQLMDQVEQWARARGAAEVRLDVWAFNDSARRFYDELGYEPRSQLLGKRLPPNAD
jgi:GNAT superfamily N-acetyltransferase